MQMDVVIVQAGNDGAVSRIEDRLACRRGELLGDLDDGLFGPDVDDGAVEQACALNQHAAKLLSLTRRCTRALSEPSSAVADGTAGAAGGIAAQWLSLGSSGNAA